MGKHRKKPSRSRRLGGYLSIIVICAILAVFAYSISDRAEPPTPARKTVPARKAAKPEPKPASLRVEIIDGDTSASMPGIAVSIGQEYLTTDASGTAGTSGLKAGEVRIISRAEGHDIYSQSHTLKSGENTLTIALRSETGIVEIDTVDNKPKAYLTIDDGPTRRYTPKVLDILKKEKATATFFFIGWRAARRRALVRRAYLEGHTIGNHTYSHNYRELYRTSSRNLLASFSRAGQLTKEIIGSASTIVRPPGGTVGNFRRGWQSSVNAAGYTTVLWNVSTGDGSTSTTSPQMVANAIRYLDRLEQDEPAVILMHDVSEPIVKALPKIIVELRKRGFEFAALDEGMREPGLILGSWRPSRSR